MFYPDASIPFPESEFIILPVFISVTLTLSLWSLHNSKRVSSPPSQKQSSMLCVNYHWVLLSSVLLHKERQDMTEGKRKHKNSEKQELAQSCHLPKSAFLNGNINHKGVCFSFTRMVMALCGLVYRKTKVFSLLFSCIVPINCPEVEHATKIGPES